MKKISLKNVISSLSRDEMKKIMAGSGGGLDGCGFCRDPTNTQEAACYRPAPGNDCRCGPWVAGCV